MNSLYKGNNEIFLKLARRNLEKNRIELEEFIQGLISNESSEDKKSLDNEFSDLANIDWIFLNSIFIALFTNFENHVSELAQIVESKVSNPITVNDIKGNWVS